MSIVARKKVAFRLLAVAGLSLLPGAAQADMQLTPIGSVNQDFSSWDLHMTGDGSAIAETLDNASHNTQVFIWKAGSGVTLIPLRGTAQSSLLSDISGDGSVVIGTEYYQDVNGFTAARGFYWTQATSTQWLGAETDALTAEAVSADGTTIVGSDYSGGDDSPIRWTSSGGVEHLSALRGYAFDVNANGTVVVGESADPVTSWQNVPFRWTQGGGMEYLPQIGGTYSRAEFVSADGNVVVGFGDDSNGRTQIWRWTGGVMTALTNDTVYSPVITDVLTDGSAVLIYQVDLWAPGGADQKSFLWRDGVGMHQLQEYNATGNTTASDMNGDGSIIIGNYYDNVAITPLRWVNEGAPESLLAVLASAGVDTSTYATDLVAEKVSDDGSIILLSGYSVATGLGQLYLMADGGSSGGGGGGGAGITTPEEVHEALKPIVQPGTQGLTAVVSGVGQSLFTARNALTSSFAAPHGLNSASGSYNLASLDLGTLSPDELNAVATAAGPMRTRYAAYSTGSFGIGQNNNYDNHNSSGNVGLLMSPAPDVALGLGVIGSRNFEQTELDGSSKVSALGGTLLASYEPENGLRLYGTAALARLEAVTNRVYANGAGTDASRGETEGLGLGLSLRFGYALEARDDWQLMPYVETEYAHSRLGAYVERNGAFPATVDAQSGDSFISRLGAEASFDLSDAFTLRGRLAWGHRYSGDTSIVATSATITQTMTTDPGSPNWAEGGITALYQLTDKTSMSFDVSGRAGDTAEPAVSGRFGLMVNF